MRHGQRNKEEADKIEGRKKISLGVGGGVANSKMVEYHRREASQWYQPPIPEIGMLNVRTCPHGKDENTPNSCTHNVNSKQAMSEAPAVTF
jgi:hypothetical protein